MNRLNPGSRSRGFQLKGSGSQSTTACNEPPHHAQPKLVEGSAPEWSGWRTRALEPGLEALAKLLELGRNRREAVGIALPFARPIILVIILGRIPFAHRLDGRHHAAVIVLVRAIDCLSRQALLLRVLGEDGRTVLRAHVIALPV